MNRLLPRDKAGVPPEALLKTRIAIDQVRLSRLATQSAIGSSRAALAETLQLLVTLQRKTRLKPSKRTALTPRKPVSKGNEAGRSATPVVPASRRRH